MNALKRKKDESLRGDFFPTISTASTNEKAARKAIGIVTERSLRIVMSTGLPAICHVRRKMRKRHREGCRKADIEDVK